MSEAQSPCQGLTMMTISSFRGIACREGHTCTHSLTHTHTRARAHTHTYTHTHTGLLTHTHDTHRPTDTHTQAHTHTHTHTGTHTHTHIHDLDSTSKFALPKKKRGVMMRKHFFLTQPRERLGERAKKRTRGKTLFYDF